MIETSSEVRVRYQETDAMGIVYHANYLTWFEIARVDMLDKLNVPYRELEAQGYLLPVLEASLKYKKPAKFDDRLTVSASIRELPSVRITVYYEVRRGNERLASGGTMHAFIGKDGYPVKPPDAFMEKVSEHFPATVS